MAQELTYLIWIGLSIIFLLIFLWFFPITLWFQACEDFAAPTGADALAKGPSGNYRNGDDYWYEGRS